VPRCVRRAGAAGPRPKGRPLRCARGGGITLRGSGDCPVLHRCCALLCHVCALQQDAWQGFAVHGLAAAQRSSAQLSSTDQQGTANMVVGAYALSQDEAAVEGILFSLGKAGGLEEKYEYAQVLLQRVGWWCQVLRALVTASRGMGCIAASVGGLMLDGRARLGRTFSTIPSLRQGRPLLRGSPPPAAAPRPPCHRRT